MKDTTPECKCCGKTEDMAILNLPRDPLLLIVCLSCDRVNLWPNFGYIINLMEAK